MRIAVVGAGYVGLTTAVCLASKGHQVYCVDLNKERIKKIRSGNPVIYEFGIEKLLKDVLKKKKLFPTTDLKKAFWNSDVSFICVGTPCGDDGCIDLAQIRNVAKEIGTLLKDREGYYLIIVKSTVIPGTIEKVVLPSLNKYSGKKVGIDFGVSMNPEFLREGHAVEDFLFPKDAGLVIGEFDKKSGDLVAEIYKGFDAEFLRTNIRTAEMIKYARNCYLAKDISFSNEIANICQRLGIDYLDVKKGLELDSRIGSGRFLDAGAGFGGSCFPKDVSAIIAEAEKNGIVPLMLQSTLKINEKQPYELLRLTKEIVGNSLEGHKITILGLAFKPGTDDIREAPSLEVIKALIREGCKVKVYDKKAMDNTRKIFQDKIEYACTIEEALQGADICIILTEWTEFANPKIYDCMNGGVIIDGRRILNPVLLSSGFTYLAIGFPGPVKT